MFRRFRYADGLRSIIYALVRYTAYTAGIAVIHSLFGSLLPLFMAVNALMLILLPIEYYLRKGMHVAQYRDINKER